jgi:hypothetical protein
MTATYIRDLNIERYERLLRVETDPDKRERIAKLLAEERASDQPKDGLDGPVGAEAPPP